MACSVEKRVFAVKPFHQFSYTPSCKMTVWCEINEQGLFGHHNKAVTLAATEE
jgi:hypothetical protein